MILDVALDLSGRLVAFYWVCLDLALVYVGVSLLVFVCIDTFPLLRESCIYTLRVPTCPSKNNEVRLCSLTPLPNFYSFVFCVHASPTTKWCIF